MAESNEIQPNPELKTKVNSANFDSTAWADALWVKADPQGCPANIRAENKRKLAGAIANTLKSTGRCRLRAFGPHAEHKANWALTIARGILATYGYDIYWYACSIDGDVNSDTQKPIKGLGFIVVFAES